MCWTLKYGPLDLRSQHTTNKQWKVYALFDKVRTINEKRKAGKREQERERERERERAGERQRQTERLNDS